MRGRSPCTREGRRPDRPDAKKGYRYETEILLRAAVRYKLSGVKGASGLLGTEGGIVKYRTGSRLGR